MRRLGPVIVGAVLLAGCFTPSSRAGPGPLPPSPPAAPAPLPQQGGAGLSFGPAPSAFELTLPRFPGPGTVALAALKGKVLLVDFWATWCGPCHEAASAYEQLYQRFHAQGLEVYGVSVDEDPRYIAAFIQSQGVTYPILVDPAAQLAGPRFDLSQIPSILLVDRAGQVRFTDSGFDAASLAQTTAHVEQLLAEPAPTP